MTGHNTSPAIESVAGRGAPKGSRGPAKPPLRELGPDPATAAPIVGKEGQYGTYLTDGETSRLRMFRDFDPRGPIERGQFHFVWPNLTINVMPGQPNLSIGPAVPNWIKFPGKPNPWYGFHSTP